MLFSSPLGMWSLGCFMSLIRAGKGIEGEGLGYKLPITVLGLLEETPEESDPRWNKR